MNLEENRVKFTDLPKYCGDISTFVELSRDFERVLDMFGLRIDKRNGFLKDINCELYSSAIQIFIC